MSPFFPASLLTWDTSSPPPRLGSQASGQGLNQPPTPLGLRLETMRLAASVAT